MSTSSTVLKSPAARPAWKSLLHEMTETTPTCPWNDSAALEELNYWLQHGAVGAACNPAIVLDVLAAGTPVF